MGIIFLRKVPCYEPLLYKFLIDFFVVRSGLCMRAAHEGGGVTLLFLCIKLISLLNWLGRGGGKREKPVEKGCTLLLEW